MQKAIRYLKGFNEIADEKYGLEFINLIIAKNFVKRLRTCNRCRVRDISRKGRVIVFEIGNCTGTGNMRQTVFEKLMEGE